MYYSIPIRDGGSLGSDNSVPEGDETLLLGYSVKKENEVFVIYLFVKY